MVKIIEFHERHFEDSKSAYNNRLGLISTIEKIGIHVANFSNSPLEEEDFYSSFILQHQQLLIGLKVKEITGSRQQDYKLKLELEYFTEEKLSAVGIKDKSEVEKYRRKKLPELEDILKDFRLVDVIIHNNNKETLYL